MAAHTDSSRVHQELAPCEPKVQCFIASLRSSPPEDPAEAGHKELDEEMKIYLAGLAERSAQVYQSLVWQDPAFEAFYVSATPIGELSRLARPTTGQMRRSCGLV